MYFGNNIDDDFGSIWSPDEIFCFFLFSLTKILVCVLCIYSIAIIIKLAISKMLWCNIKTLYVKKGKLLRGKIAGSFFYFSFFLWCITVIFGYILQKYLWKDFVLFFNNSILFCIKYATEATLWRKYWWLHRILFKGWYIIIMPLQAIFICFCSIW